MQKKNYIEENNLIKILDVLEYIPNIFHDMLIQSEGNVIIEEVHSKIDENNDDIQYNVPINLENDWKK